MYQHPKLFFATALLLLAFLACKSFSKKEPNALNSIKNNEDQTMAIPTLPPPSGDYADDWKIVDSLQRQGLFKSALDKSTAIYTQASRDKNNAQIVKALIFRGKFMTMLEEDGLIQAIQLVENELKTTGQPAQSVLQSVLGQLYNNYLRNQGWDLRNRTPIPDGEGGDILTWSAEQVEKRALACYSASIEANALLAGIPVAQFGDILTPSRYDSVAQKPLRPTLFDFLAHRALEHFSNERSYLSEPAYAFTLREEEDFAAASVFGQKKYATEDKTSGKWLAINLFQKLLAQYAPKAGQGAGGIHPAFFDLELERLQFVFNNSIHEKKDALYRNALENLLKQAEPHPSYGEIAAQLAQYLINTDAGEKGKNAQDAAKTLENALRLHPDTYGAQHCAQLLGELRRPTLSARVEEVSLPNQSVLLSVGYRNLSKIWVKVVKSNFEKHQWETMNWEAQYAYLQSLPAIETKNWAVTDPGDYQEHHTEVALDGLDFGNYWVFVCENSQFTYDKSTISYANWVVSNLASVSYNEAGNTKFVLANRQTGAPLPGVTLDFFQYDYNTSPRSIRKTGNATSDREGFVKNAVGQNQQVEVRASKGRDTLWIGQAYNYRPRNNPRKETEVRFFTDRSIYRPGQTVYFKGLVYQRSNAQNPDGEAPQIVANETVTVQFLDANRQKKGELVLKSNEFGTFQGTFTAPATGLTGSMSIQVSQGARGQTNISVEEYKRPRFEVAILPVKGAFRLNETVQVQGEAKNYAGSVVDGAEVKYRVVRVVRFPYWDYSSYWKQMPYYNSAEMEVANGNTQTDEKGAFSINFMAIPDGTIPKKNQPVFDYFITAVVTDISGETQSQQYQLSAGYAALQVEWDLPTEIALDSLRNVGIRSTNMAGQPQDAKGQITLQRLVAPKQFFKARMWEIPDIMTLTKTEFEQKFPDLAWKDEDNPENWDREDFTRSVPFNTATDKSLDLHQNRLQAGWYLAKLTTQDSYGEKVEIQRFVRAWTPGNRFEKPAAAAQKNSYEPGETARITFGGKPAGLHFFFAHVQGGELEKPEWVSSLLKGLSSVDIPVRESDRGGIPTHYFCIYNNRIYGVEQIYLSVPWSNKDLKIEYQTFRDKLAPGQKEEWRIKISGPKKDKVMAEMVAAMYDASLDQFRPHQWSGIPFPQHYSPINFNTSYNFGWNGGNNHSGYEPISSVPNRVYPALNWFDFPLWGRPDLYEKVTLNAYRGNEVAADRMMEMDSAPAGAPKASMKAQGGGDDPPSYQEVAVKDETTTPPKSPAPPAGIRRNLNETVFFFPQLKTDAEGRVVLSFTMNEALTRWKLLTYAHTKELQQAVSVREVVTQKDLMVIPNPPRFLRQGDEIEFSAKVSNLSKEKIDGVASLNLLDAAQMTEVLRAFGLAANTRVARFSVLPGQSSAVSWRVKVPDEYVGAVTWQISAEGNNFTDGEESTIPVVSNRLLVTETMPISLRGKQSKTFTFEHLKNQGESSTLNTHRYTLEFTSNPVWYAVQALPYLMEFPHECSEQVFSRLYANTLASNVVAKMPQIKRVYERWKGSGAMESNLSKNQELKYALLEETPWVLDAQNEAQQKQQIALLFDLNRMADERERALNTLSDRQLNSGGWPWFSGGQDSWYITQYIATGFYHLQKLGALDLKNDQKSIQMLDDARGYCTRKLNEQYAALERRAQKDKLDLNADHLDDMAIQYLYMSSFSPLDRPSKEVGYYLGQAEKYWLGKGLYQEGLLALALHRWGRKDAATRIVASLRERATLKEELGMFWPVDWGYYWYQLPVETQALMVEVFSEVANDAKSVEELRIWLLKNKQTNRWESTKATAEAVYALLLNGDNWLNNTQPVKVSMGGSPLSVQEYEAGTGYFKQSWSGAEVKKSWATLAVENPNSNIVWGAAYWQYFEDLDNIQAFKKTPLTIEKQLFLEKNSPTGPILTRITPDQVLQRGDKIKVRIEIRVDRAMEFVHLKDMRAAGLEPINVLSGYRWQGSLGYYESTKDLATHFFFDYLPRGTFVFEYPLVVSLRGDMSNGITTMQCMYAPEFSTHSKGMRVRVE